MSELLAVDVRGEEFLLWRAWDAVHPIDGERLIAQEAQTAQVLMNVNRDTKKRPQPFSLDEAILFRPYEPPKPRTLTRAEEEDVFRESFYARGLVVRKTK